MYARTVLPLVVDSWSTYRLVEGVPRPYMSGGFKQLMEEALEVVFDWVRANKEAIEARYGPFQVGRQSGGLNNHTHLAQRLPPIVIQEDRDPCLHSMLLSFTNHLFPGTGASGSCMMAAALVAHALVRGLDPSLLAVCLTPSLSACLLPGHDDPAGGGGDRRADAVGLRAGGEQRMLQGAGRGQGPGSEGGGPVRRQLHRYAHTYGSYTSS